MTDLMVAIICIPVFACCFSLSYYVAACISEAKKRKLEYQRTHTVTDEFVDKMLPSGVYIIVGPQGVGKTSLMMAIMSTDFKYHGAERIQDAQADVAALNALPQEHPFKLTAPACAYRTRTKLTLPNGKPTYHCDVSQFGLPEGQKDVQFFPKSTFLGFDEIDSFMDCRKWQQDKQSIIDGLKYIRHQNLVFLGDAQNFDKIDAAVRRLTTDLFYVTGKHDVWVTHKHLFRHPTRELVATEWTFYWVKQQQVANAAALKSKGFDINEQSFVRKCKFIYQGNIYRQYDSLSGKPYWYNGLEKYEIEKHPTSGLTRDGIKQFVEQNALRFDKVDNKKTSGEKNPSSEDNPSDSE